MVIRRRPLFYTVNLLLPSIFLMVMDIVGFYLPPDSGERVSFKITLLLGYSVFLIIVSDTLPATAIGTPLIGKWSILFWVKKKNMDQMLVLCETAWRSEKCLSLAVKAISVMKVSCSGKCLQIVLSLSKHDHHVWLLYVCSSVAEKRYTVGPTHLN